MLFTRHILIFALFTILLTGCVAQNPTPTQPPASVDAPGNGPTVQPNIFLTTTDTATLTPFTPTIPLQQRKKTPTPSSAAGEESPQAMRSPVTTQAISATQVGGEDDRITPQGLSVSSSELAQNGCLLEPGQMITATLETRLVRLPLAYRVYLPPCYDDIPDKRYPSLYLFHGQSYNDDQWDRMGADETADRLIASGEFHPLIIVMPYERYGGQPTETCFTMP